MHNKYNHKVGNNQYAEFIQNCDLKEYEELCPKCNGWGDIKVYCNCHKLCNICNGTGRIDWIDKIKMGIK